jgi:hypothetical protein
MASVANKPTVILSNTDLLCAAKEWIAKHRPDALRDGEWCFQWQADPRSQAITVAVTRVGPANPALETL